MVAAQLHELRWLRAETSVEHVVFLTGQDYPVGPLAAWERQISESGADLVGDAFPVSFRPRWLRRGSGDRRARRAMFRYYRVRSSSHLRALKLLGPVVDTQRIPHSDELFVGVRSPLRGLEVWWSLPWLVLSRRAVGTVLEQSTEPWATRFRRSLLPEESFIPTAVARAGLRISRQPVTFCRFPYLAYHPDTLTTADLPEISAAGAPFARKFDEQVDSLVLDRLDKRATAPASRRC